MVLTQRHDGGPTDNERLHKANLQLLLEVVKSAQYTLGSEPDKEEVRQQERKATRILQRLADVILECVLNGAFQDTRKLRNVSVTVPSVSLPSTWETCESQVLFWLFRSVSESGLDGAWEVCEAWFFTPVVCHKRQP